MITMMMMIVVELELELLPLLELLELELESLVVDVVDDVDQSSGQVASLLTFEEIVTPLPS